MTILHFEIWTNVTAKENTTFDALKGVVELVIKTACHHIQQSKPKPTEQKNYAESKLKRFYLEGLNREILTGNSNYKRNAGNTKKNYDPELCS